MQKWIEDLVHVLRNIHEDIDPILSGKYSGEVTDMLELTANNQITPSIKVYSTNNIMTVNLCDVKVLVAPYVIVPSDTEKDGIKSYKTAISLNTDNYGTAYMFRYYGPQINIFFDARYFQKKIINLSSDETIYFIKNIKYVILNIIKKNPIYSSIMDDKAMNVLTLSAIFAVIKELNVPILMKYIYEEFRTASVDILDALFDNYDVDNHLFKYPPWLIPKV